MCLHLCAIIIKMPALPWIPSRRIGVCIRRLGYRPYHGLGACWGPSDPTPYISVFKPAANVSDELGLFLPTIGNSSVGLFLEREQGEFKRCEIESAKIAFPILSSLEKAHIGQVFSGLRNVDPFLRSVQFSPKPILVQDRCGVEIFSSASWKEAIEKEPDLLPAT